MNERLGKDIDTYIKEHRYRLINSVLVYHKNNVLVENYYHSYDENTKHPIFSIWKSIISLAIGICVDQKLLQLGDPICKYLDAFNQLTHPYHRMITIENLLTMTSGIYWNSGIHYHCPMLEQIRQSDNWITYISDIAMKDMPGTRFQYKEWDVILLSAIISKVSKKNTYDFCKQHLLKPLEITCQEWPITACGVTYNHIYTTNNQVDLSTRDLLKIGLLLKNNGKYLNTQVISSSYMKRVKSNDMHKEYGYLLWLFSDYYACRGFGGQNIIVSLKGDIIVVIQAESSSRGKSYEDIFTKVIKDNIL
ncbi:MAG: serine hydrolase domain-containing protein [Coprobacillaceae bacterium]